MQAVSQCQLGPIRDSEAYLPPKCVAAAADVQAVETRKLG